MLEPDTEFDLSVYNNAVKKELEAFGFELEVVSKPKIQTQIVSAFIKADTKIQLLHLKVPEMFARYLPKGQQLNIKMEVDTDPPPLFKTETKSLLQPIPFSVNTYRLEDAFAGKMHAMLSRNWKLRVKGRDWYDFVWFMGRNIAVRLDHLEQRLRQSNGWNKSAALTEHDFKAMLRDKINTLDIEKAKADVRVFLRDPASIDIWSTTFFLELAEKLRVS